MKEVDNINTLYYYAQDGTECDASVKKIFGLDEHELFYSTKTEKSYFNIVGFVFRDNKILVVFPKHYYEEAYISQLNQTNKEVSEDIQLLYSVIKNMMKKNEQEQKLTVILDHTADTIRIIRSGRFMKYIIIIGSMGYTKKMKT